MQNDILLSFKQRNSSTFHCPLRELDWIVLNIKRSVCVCPIEEVVHAKTFKNVFFLSNLVTEYCSC